MKPTSQTEAFVYQAVLSGALEIRQDGSIWRIAEERGNRWNKKTTLRPIVPHRVDETKSGGYRLVKVMRSRKQVTTGAHRLVYLHFHGQIPPGLTVNHKNGIKHDNHPDNLELATYAEQVKHARTTLGRKWKTDNQNGEANDMAKLTDAAVREIRRRRAAGASLKSIAADFGISDRTVSKIARGDRWAHVLS